MLTVVIFTPERILYDGEARSVFLPGSSGEFEVLEFHKPIMSRLRNGHIVIDSKKEITIRAGVAALRNDRLVAMVEE